MANTTSAKKAIRVTLRRTRVNQMRRVRVRTLIRKVETAIVQNDAVAARSAMLIAESEIARAAQKGIFHHRTAARKISHLATRVAACEGHKIASL